MVVNTMFNTQLFNTAVRMEVTVSCFPLPWMVTAVEHDK